MDSQIFKDFINHHHAQGLPIQFVQACTDPVWSLLSHIAIQNQRVLTSWTKLKPGFHQGVLEGLGGILDLDAKTFFHFLCMTGSRLCSGHGGCTEQVSHAAYRSKGKA